MIEYADGPQTVFGGGHEWKPDRSIVEQLKELDWDSERQTAMSGCQIFDQMTANTKDLPPQLPSTKQLQKAFRGQMKAFLKAKRSDESKCMS